MTLTVSHGFLFPVRGFVKAQVNPYSLTWVFSGVKQASVSEFRTILEDSLLCRGGWNLGCKLQSNSTSNKYTALKLCSWPCLWGKGFFVNMVSAYPIGTAVSLHFDLFELCSALQSEQQNEWLFPSAHHSAPAVCLNLQHIARQGSPAYSVFSFIPLIYWVSKVLNNTWGRQPGGAHFGTRGNFWEKRKQ